jgi:hypothetical protein
MRCDIHIDCEISNLWRASNEAMGIANTDDAGFHESITQVYLNAVRDFMALNPALSILEACNQTLRSEVSDRDFCLNYYSESLLFSVAARRSWVTPDKNPLPMHWPAP